MKRIYTIKSKYWKSVLKKLIKKENKSKISHNKIQCLQNVNTVTTATGASHATFRSGNHRAREWLIHVLLQSSLNLTVRNHHCYCYSNNSKVHALSHSLFLTLIFYKVHFLPFKFSTFSTTDYKKRLRHHATDSKTKTICL